MAVVLRLSPKCLGIVRFLVQFFVGSNKTLLDQSKIERT